MAASRMLSHVTSSLVSASNIIRRRKYLRQRKWRIYEKDHCSTYSCRSSILNIRGTSGCRRMGRKAPWKRRCMQSFMANRRCSHYSRGHYWNRSQSCSHSSTDIRLCTTGTRNILHSGSILRAKSICGTNAILCAKSLCGAGAILCVKSICYTNAILCATGVLSRKIIGLFADVIIQKGRGNHRSSLQYV